jgi:2TM domain
MNEQITRDRAERRVEKKIGFYIHALVYAAVMSLLAGLNLAREHATLWFLWPLFGWGAGLAFHGLSVFLFDGVNPSLKERMIEREMKSER